MYKIKILDSEINKINNLEVFKSTKKALMSIYSYFLKYGATREEGLKVSFDDFFDMYKRWHKFAKTKANFVKLSYKLVDLGLLTIKKMGNKNIYFARKNNTESSNDSRENSNTDNENINENSNDNLFIDNGVKEEVNREVNIKKSIEPSINTSFEESTVSTQILNTKTNYYYIIKDTEVDDNLSSSSINNFVSNPVNKDINNLSEDNLSNYEKAIIKNNKVKLDYVQASSLGYDILEERNIKTEKIINKVMDILIRLDGVIVKKNARAYIDTVIDNTCAWYERRRIAYATKVKHNKPKVNNSYFENAYNLNEMTLDEIDKIFD